MLSVASFQDDGQGNGENLFHTFLGRATSVADAAESATALLCGDSLRDNVRGLTSDLSELGKRASELRMISSLAKVACTESEDIDRRLGAFVQTLDGRSDDLGRIAKESSEAVSRIWSASGRAADSLRAMTSDFRVLSVSTGDEAARLRALAAAHREHVSGVQGASHRLAENVRGSVARLIDCLQFPDAFAQRAEHVAAMLAALEEDRPAAERAAIARLADAQLCAMADALESVTRDADDALTSILQTLGSDFAADNVPGRNPSVAYLEAATRVNATMLTAADAARSRTRRSAWPGERCSETHRRRDRSAESLDVAEQAARNCGSQCGHCGKPFRLVDLAAACARGKRQDGCHPNHDFDDETLGGASAVP